MKNNDELLSALKQFIECWEDTKAAEEMENEDHPFETEEDADEAALKELNAELHELMELQGFTYWQTGGGCTAWGKFIFGGNDCKSPYVMVTCGEDAYGYFGDLAEAHSDVALCVGFYDNEGVPLHDGVVAYSWDEFKNNFKGGF